MTLMLPTSRAASTTNQGIAAGVYWLVMTLLAAGAANALIIGAEDRGGTLLVVVGYALVAASANLLRWAPTGGPVIIVSAAALLICGVALASWQVAIISAAGFSSDSYFFSSIAIAAVLLGALVWRSGHAALVCTVTLVVTQLILAMVALSNGGRWRVDVPALVTWAVLFVVLLTLEFSRRHARQSAITFAIVDAENAEDTERRRLALLSTAVLHDTVLGDLTTLATTAPGRIPERTAARLRDTVALLRSGTWLTAVDETPADERLTALLSKFAARDTTTTLAGDVGTLSRVTDDVAGELLRALEQCLDNVVRHARATAVEVSVMAAPEELTVMVSDDGIGFEPEHADPARLGVRASIQARIAAVGGRAHVWSAPGSGTTVLLTVPTADGNLVAGPER